MLERDDAVVPKVQRTALWASQKFGLRPAAQKRLALPAAVDERLRAECKLLQALGALCCRACGASLARSADAVQVGRRAGGGRRACTWWGW